MSQLILLIFFRKNRQTLQKIVNSVVLSLVGTRASHSFADVWIDPSTFNQPSTQGAARGRGVGY